MVQSFVIADSFPGNFRVLFAAIYRRIVEISVQKLEVQQQTVQRWICCVDFDNYRMVAADVLDT